MSGGEPVPLSALQHWEFCPRQCALIHLDGAWVENAATAAGRRAHGRVDEARTEIEGDLRREFGLALWSERLGLIGKADCVEFAADGAIRPVEYKRGPRKRRRADDIQLCAQALCLEEMFGRSVPAGDIFHVASRRRRVVDLDATLRAGVAAAASAVRAMQAAAVVPGPANDARCVDCSLRPVCLPAVPVRVAADRLFEPLGDVDA